ncbi:M14 family metallopeptidase [Flavobacterium caeni]|uniref:Zinc carboxypeptidase n=1 Tax=Flavobacterium caeni TaxID=490189 RepID=A0A1G5CVW3_9FLAO|nr:M14 metallopeptidase family protein [Flavobacterium caeni]SCY06585.1 Zinc carboxypeptidase [Flavobacterium caeni]
MEFAKLFEQYRIPHLSGRYVTLNHIEPLLAERNTNNQLQVLGQSVQGRPVYAYTIGTGKIRILMWSQMHGNESTTTKALMDFLNLLHSGTELADNLLRDFTFCCLPMVNPDGAEVWTRENANGVDLNRDAFHRSQPESQLLRKIFEDFKPDCCYNLHDQRTIFGAGDTGKPATVSFLAPSFNEERHIHHARARAVGVIAAMNEEIQRHIPGQVGRFDDTFNINCVGDTFQLLNVPTVLIEGGHYPNDYARDVTRKYIFIALLSGFEFLNENVIVSNGLQEYLNIPQNKICFFDFVYKNVKINYEDSEIITNFAAQFKEELSDGKLVFNAYVAKIGGLDDFFGHVEWDAKEAVLYAGGDSNIIEVDQKADFNLGKNVKVVNGIVEN